MRVIFLPLNFGSVTQKGVEDAFIENGCDLQVFDYFQEYANLREDRIRVRNLLLERAAAFRPDLIHMQIQHTDIIDAQTVQRLKHHLPDTKIVNWTGDVRNYIPETYSSVGQFADFNLISSTGQIQMFEERMKKPIGYWQIGYDPKLYFPEEPSRQEFEFDAIFIANHNSREDYPGRREREQTVIKMRERFHHRFALFGWGWEHHFGARDSLEQKVVGQYYHKSFCNISVSHYNGIDNYFSDRLLMCMASGRPTICLRYPHWENYWTDGCDIVMADSVDDIPNKVRWLLDNRDLAEYIGASGAAKVFAEHTYTSRVKELLKMVTNGT